MKRGIGASVCAIGVAALVSAQACDDVPTDRRRATSELPLDDLSLYVSARSNGEAVLVQSSASDGDGVLDFAASDHVWVTPDGGVPVELTPFDEFSRVALVSTTALTLEIALVRDGGPEARALVELPPPLTIEVADAGASVSGGFDVAWGDGVDGGTLDVAVQGACIEPFGRRLERDTGAYTVQAGDLRGVGAAPCDGVVVVTRTASRSALPIGADSTIASAQVRTAALGLSP